MMRALAVADVRFSTRRSFTAVPFCRVFGAGGPASAVTEVSGGGLIVSERALVQNADDTIRNDARIRRIVDLFLEVIQGYAH